MALLALRAAALIGLPKMASMLETPDSEEEDDFSIVERLFVGF